MNIQPNNSPIIFHFITAVTLVENEDNRFSPIPTAKASSTCSCAHADDASFPSMHLYLQSQIKQKTKHIFTAMTRK